MRLLVSNVYKGCLEEERFVRLVNLVRRYRPTVMGILEANGWDENGQARLKTLAERVGYEYYFFGQANSNYDLALISQLPMKAENLPGGFKHTCIRVEIEGLKIFLVHLNPDSEDDRLEEVEILLGYIGGHPQNTMLMGDMNSLSPADREFYEQDGLWQKCKEQGITKFGEQGLRYDVIRRLLGAGLVDVGQKYERGKLEFTTPTPVNIDVHHLAELRLDCVFVSPDLPLRVTDFKVVNNGITKKMSDHFPILIDIGESF